MEKDRPVKCTSQPDSLGSNARTDTSRYHPEEPTRLNSAYTSSARSNRLRSGGVYDSRLPQKVDDDLLSTGKWNQDLKTQLSAATAGRRLSHHTHVTVSSGDSRWKPVTSTASAVVSSDSETELNKLFLRIVMMAEAGLRSTKRENMHLDVECTFDFKARVCKGSALHVAALYRRSEPCMDGRPPDDDGARLVRILLTYFQADIFAVATYDSNGKTGTTQALHLAAARGNLEVVRTLLDMDPGREGLPLIEERTTLENKPNHTALHEAAQQMQVEVAMLLLERGANVNEASSNKNSALHLAAKNGCGDMARVLVNARADLSQTNNKHKTPLLLAIEEGRLPVERVHMLATKRIDELLEVAECSPSAANSLLLSSRRTSESGEAVVHPTWREVLLETSEIGGETMLDKWVRLMLQAPRAGANLLDSAICEPEAQDSKRHWLPRRARISFRKKMRCWYHQHKTWRYFPEDTDYGNRIPEWHRNLAKGVYTSSTSSSSKLALFTRFQDFIADATERVDSLKDGVLAELENTNNTLSSKEMVNVNVRQVQLRGVLSTKVLYALASSSCPSVFAHLSIQAIVNCAWDEVAARFHRLNIFYRMIEIAVQMIWVIDSQSRYGYFRRLTWDVVFILTCRETIAEIFEMRGYHKMGRPWWYVSNLRNFGDYVALVLNFVLLFNTYDNYQVTAHPKVLAFAAVCRWFMLLLQFRSIHFLGKQLLPLFKSIMPMMGILFITICAFCCVMHGFMALDLANPDSDPIEVFLGTFGLLMVGDGGGIETVLTLGNADKNGTALTQICYVISSVVFMVLLVNLLIAVHGDAYTTANGRAELLFLQERAAMSLQCFLRPSFPSWWFRRFVPPGCFRCFEQAVRGSAVCMMILSWVIVGFLTHSNTTPILIVLIGLFGLQISDLLLLQRPWITDSESGTDDVNYLWICVRADYDPKSIAPILSSENDEKDSTGSLVNSLRRDQLHNARQMSKQVQSVKQSLSREFHKSLQDQVGSLREEVSEAKEAIVDVADRMARLEQLMLSALRASPHGVGEHSGMRPGSAAYTEYHGSHLGYASSQDAQFSPSSSMAHNVRPNTAPPGGLHEPSTQQHNGPREPRDSAFSAQIARPPMSSEQQSQDTSFEAREATMAPPPPIEPPPPPPPGSPPDIHLQS
jgi:ankyrin repeat protein/energy-coupling factor transporter transmembrane protein EcfT